jgi:hypothetical protein
LYLLFGTFVSSYEYEDTKVSLVDTKVSLVDTKVSLVDTKDTLVGVHRPR